MTKKTKVTLYLIVMTALVTAIALFGSDKKLTSIEYLEKCSCGKMAECYKSYVDGYSYKECKHCGKYE